MTSPLSWHEFRTVTVPFLDYIGWRDRGKYERSEGNPVNCGSPCLITLNALFGGPPMGRDNMLDGDLSGVIAFHLAIGATGRSLLHGTARPRP